MKPVYFERAIFLGWYCKLKDCAFCYMSTIQTTKKSLRSQESVLAEALICKKLNWKIEFLSSGYKAYPFNRLLPLIKNIYLLTKQKQWLNIGPLTEPQIKKLKKYIEGYSGAIECVNLKLRKKLCPSKPLRGIINTFKLCDKYKLKKSITIIIGLGETLNDFKHIEKLIKEYKTSRITFYALKPQKGTIFKKAPIKEYYAGWISKTRKAFPGLKIIVGIPVKKLDGINLLLKAGANNLTKFSSINLFNSKSAKQIESQVKQAKRIFKGSLTKLPDVNWNEEINNLPFNKQSKSKINKKLQEYLKIMKKPKP